MINQGLIRKPQPAGDGSVPLRVGAPVFVLAAVFYMWAALVGWSHTIEDRHPLRQAQTALSAQYMVGTPFKLSYETPIFGPPWSIPMEFPLYQWLVAKTCEVSKWSLDESGRAVGILFHLLSVFMGSMILSSLGITKGSRLLVLALWLLSPFYIFWSRTLMIESTALFLSLAYLAAILRARSHRPELWLGVAVALGCLAAAVKVTTFAAFGLVGGCMFAWHVWNLRRQQGNWLAPAFGLCAATVLPLASAIWWTSYADMVKSASVIGRELMSSTKTAWNYGTIPQKLSIDTWTAILSRTGTMVAYSRWLFWMVALSGIGFACLVGRRRKIMIGSLVLFIVPMLIFTNLYFVHDYYQYANGIFVIAAIGVALVELLENPRFRWLGYACYVGVICAAGSGYFRLNYAQQSIDCRSAWEFAQIVRSHSHAEDVNIFLGPINDGTCAYYSGRRALIIANGHNDADVREMLGRIRGYNVGGIFVQEGNLYSVAQVKGVARDLGLGDLNVYELK